MDKAIIEMIDKVIRAYIKYTLKVDERINEYVPNTHIAETFKDVLIYSELEAKNENVFHNVKQTFLLYNKFLLKIYHSSFY
jgi:hypothetical protein